MALTPSSTWRCVCSLTKDLPGKYAVFLASSGSNHDVSLLRSSLTWEPLRGATRKNRRCFGRLPASWSRCRVPRPRRPSEFVLYSASLCAQPIPSSARQVQRPLGKTLKARGKVIVRRHVDKNGKQRVSGGPDLRSTQRYPIGWDPSSRPLSLKVCRPRRETRTALQPRLRHAVRRAVYGARRQGGAPAFLRWEVRARLRARRRVGTVLRATPTKAGKAGTSWISRTAPAKAHFSMARLRLIWSTPAEASTGAAYGAQRLPRRTLQWPDTACSINAFRGARVRVPYIETTPAKAQLRNGRSSPAQVSACKGRRLHGARVQRAEQRTQRRALQWPASACKGRRLQRLVRFQYIENVA